MSKTGASLAKCLGDPESLFRLWIRLGLLEQFVPGRPDNGHHPRMSKAALHRNRIEFFMNSIEAADGADVLLVFDLFCDDFR